jgi:hypothetical protein
MAATVPLRPAHCTHWHPSGCADIVGMTTTDVRCVMVVQLCVVGRGAWGYADAMWARRRVVVVRRDGNNIVVVVVVGVCLMDVVGVVVWLLFG